MGWVKEGNWPWKYYVELQTANPSYKSLISDSGICGNKRFRTLWGGGKTEKQAIASMERQFKALIKQLKKEANENKDKNYITF